LCTYKMLTAAGTGRILCLHGSGDTAAGLLTALAPLAASCPGWAFDAIDAPSGTGKWWTYAPGMRSYTATAYEGAEESIEVVEAKLISGGYIGVLGFSQGAMLTAILAARSALGEGAPLKLAICCAAALPKPYEGLLQRLRGAPSPLPIRTLHTLSKRDGMNPPNMGEDVAACFAASEVSWHDGGHAIPKDAAIARFLERAAAANVADADESD